MARSTKPLLFVHSSGPTHAHQRDEAVKTKIRQHIMADIGRARRKRPRNPKVEVVMQPWSDADVDRRELPKTGHNHKAHGRCTRCHCQPPANSSATASPVFPFWSQNPLVTLERHWGMDMFSAYGIAFVMNEGANRRLRSRSKSKGATGGGGFWFPFAFRASAFLRHFRQTIISPEVLDSVTDVPENTLQAIALQRSTGTIACIEEKLAARDAGVATSDSVIRGVLASICYNFVSMDCDQARIHMKGLTQLISARGATESPLDDEELRLMIFWVDITASLLFSSKPHFPVPADLIPASPLPTQSDISALPLRYLQSQPSPVTDEYTATILYCLRDLWGGAAYIQSKGTFHETEPWTDEESIGLRLNPLAHRLLSISPSTESRPASSHGTAISRALQLGQILFIIIVKRAYRSYPGSPAVYALKLVRLLSDTRVWAGDAGLPSVRLWLLVLCGISLCGGKEESMVVDMIGHVMRRWDLDSWKDVTGYVRQMPWVRLFDPLCVNLESRLL
ncbi:hypothetical protein BJX68DRAFT_269054 [Aspergillus pseudodeflectus]|uniref:Fungal-specific transcription factor domain-containing protein n=1 Tax=Aspergillus pseudodeflectus TaxID=176178 RepID=A0ABR4JZQ0_9EURO